jgi:hypothetical protein
LQRQAKHLVLRRPFGRFRLDLGQRKLACDGEPVRLGTRALDILCVLASAKDAALEKLARERRRDGAYAWGVFEDAAAEGRMVETFLVESWLEHLRQHERVTNADRVLQETVHRFQVEGAPKITHLIAAEPHPAEPKSD